jgi:DNA-directed RNA polymerase subunit RPC12/RpoP
MMDLSNLGKEKVGNEHIDMSKSTPILCSECGHDMFMPAMKFRKISGIVNGTGKDKYIPVEVYFCSSCGNINPEFDYAG